jgi:hypothetical protein
MAQNILFSRSTGEAFVVKAHFHPANINTEANSSDFLTMLKHDFLSRASNVSSERDVPYGVTFSSYYNDYFNICTNLMFVQ